jgi:hypothetical protein
MKFLPSLYLATKNTDSLETTMSSNPNIVDTGFGLLHSAVKNTIPIVGLVKGAVTGATPEEIADEVKQANENYDKIFSTTGATQDGSK